MRQASRGESESALRVQDDGAPLQADVSKDDAEALVRFLTEHVLTLMSPHADPVPSCPRCGGTQIHKKGYAPLQTGPLPTYQCEGCGHYFSRLSGTPLSGHRIRRSAEELITLLPQAIGCPEAARRLGVMERTIRNTVRMFRRWVFELDPSGHYERHIRLGGRFTAVRDQAPPVVDEQIAHEDVALTATLLKDFDTVHSDKHFPMPDCPACGAVHLVTKGTFSGFARFKCASCGKQFNRRTGTPFTRNRKVHQRQRALIRYLGLPLSITQLAEIVGGDHGNVARLIREFRERCDQLVPLHRGYDSLAGLQDRQAVVVNEQFDAASEACLPADQSIAF
ncbi:MULTISPECIES: DUF746 domain-containing protein, partial [Ralstonia solanacearum species complex]